MLVDKSFKNKFLELHVFELFVNWHIEKIRGDVTIHSKLSLVGESENGNVIFRYKRNWFLLCKACL